MNVIPRESEALERLRKVEPDISTGFVEQSLPMAAPDARDRFLQGLELAGMDQADKRSVANKAQISGSMS